MIYESKEELNIEKDFVEFSKDCAAFLISNGYESDIEIEAFENSSGDTLEVNAITSSKYDPLKLFTDITFSHGLYSHQVDEMKMLCLKYGFDVIGYQIIDNKIIIEKEEAMYEQNH